MTFSRKFFAAAAVATTVAVAGLGQAFAVDTTPYSDAAFKAAQTAGQPILIEIHAGWCPTCKAQKPIIDKLAAEPKFKELKIFRVDFDDQKPVVKGFGAQMQSTLIVFKGASETGRSVGDTKEASISALLDKSL
ncbi:putative Thioredoxin (H-type,TRX-H) [Bradyrhizobium sp. ORS 375]|uniref:thioredoxin family protein n=1 Tax=Bradyrhizobium sp. (strain ORS 375) TaxID=566679 RepID=UPI0002407FCF|nr:thioredoxin family protein [Bradyrhizobium sp. ORS 375]CCD92024.1 putative Thioredoxin (H-type,TRX-H) [Bradyrhizobium sp. ORS 375]